MNSHYCCLLRDLPDTSTLQKKKGPKQTQTKPTLMILYCFHNLVFSTVSPELVNKTWELLIKNHLLGWSKCMREARHIH